MTVTEASDADASGEVQDTATVIKRDIGTTSFDYDRIAGESTQPLGDILAI
jgi:hypothetical protein